MNSQLAQKTIPHQPRISVAHLGARGHYIVPKALHAAGMLHCFYTDATASKWPFNFLHYLPRRLRSASLQRLLQRTPGLPLEKIHSFQSLGLEHKWKRDRAKTISDVARIDLWAADQFSDKIIKRADPSVSGYYAMNTCARNLFKWCRNNNIATILEQTSAPTNDYQAAQAIEREKWPRWGTTRQQGNSLQTLAECEQEEWTLADIILCPSSYVQEGLLASGVPANKLKVVPYGLANFGYKHVDESGCRQSASQPLRILFVGKVCLMKGVPYLLDSLRQFKKNAVTARIVGPVVCDPDILAKACPNNIAIIGSVPRNEVLKHYEWADIFCLPSISEGSAMVINEALAAGLPVITTQNSGSIVRDGIEGYIVPKGDSMAIAKKIELLSQDDSLLNAMQEAALRRSELCTLESYTHRLINEVTSSMPCTK